MTVIGAKLWSPVGTSEKRTRRIPNRLRSGQVGFTQGNTARSRDARGCVVTFAVPLTSCSLCNSAFRLHSEYMAQGFLKALCLLLLSSALWAEGTQLWQQSKFEEFEKGTSNGVAISSDGNLHLAFDIYLASSERCSGQCLSGCGIAGTRVSRDSRRQSKRHFRSKGTSGTGTCDRQRRHDLRSYVPRRSRLQVAAEHDGSRKEKIQ